VRDIVDASGLLINTITYDSFGNVLSQINAAAGDRYLFTGREFDAETGLYYYRARYYDPATGRFVSQDPIGFDAGDANLYRYVGNAPTNATDPFGLLTVGSYNATLQPAAILLAYPQSSCFVISAVSSLASSAAIELFISSLPGQDFPSTGELLVDGAVDLAFAAISCSLFPPAQLANASFSAVAVNLQAVVAKSAITGAATATITGNNFFAFANFNGKDGGGFEKMKGGNNKFHNKKFKDLADDLGLSKSQRNRLHDEIGKRRGEKLGIDDIRGIAEDLFGS